MENMNNIGLGKVSFSQNGKINTSGAVPYVNAQMLVPYGMAVAVPVGENTFMFPVGNTALCMGVVQKPFSIPLQNGEVMLYSSGGANIILKNDGRVLINGREV